MRPDDSLEQAARKRGYALVCGCDEAGAGPLMGPVCAGAVILPEGCDIPGLDDSKKLTEKKREACTVSSPKGPLPGPWPPSVRRRSTPRTF